MPSSITDAITNTTVIVDIKRYIREIFPAFNKIVITNLSVSKLNSFK